MSAPPDEVAGPGHDRVAVLDLIAAMTLEEKLAQLVGLWQGVDRDSGAVAPLQDAMDTVEQGFAEFAAHGLGRITRHHGTRPRYGFELGYPEFACEDFAVGADRVDVAGEIRCAVTARDAGDRAGAEAVRVYASAPSAALALSALGEPA
ncbi:hypothetical protein ACIQ7D_03450 [Streptomyces sp. NPDC096310]|uniref:hypothetical protein n=1 Tax=Streptomyces sp. NPDC096310 TaxID=3366082 RepID=UPI00382BD233